MPLPDYDLAGLSADAAKEYILAHAAQIKLDEKQAAALEEEAAVWERRAALAASKNEAGLAAEAEQRVRDISGKAALLRQEAAELRAMVKRMTEQVPGLAARERRVDPDLLLQELLITAGMNPGEENLLGQERKFAALEKEAGADAALAALKAKMGAAAANDRAGAANGPAAESGPAGEATANPTANETAGNPAVEGGQL